MVGMQASVLIFLGQLVLVAVAREVRQLPEGLQKHLEMRKKQLIEWRQPQYRQEILEPSELEASLQTVRTKLFHFTTTTLTISSVAESVVTVFATCTTAAPDVAPCDYGVVQPTSTPSYGDPTVVTPESNRKSGSAAVEPSCDCAGGNRVRQGIRTPRMEDDPKTFSFTYTTTATVPKYVTSTAPVTVTIAYHGCIPSDAISAISCTSL